MPIIQSFFLSMVFFGDCLGIDLVGLPWHYHFYRQIEKKATSKDPFRVYTRDLNNLVTLITRMMIFYATLSKTESALGCSQPKPIILFRDITTGKIQKSQFIFFYPILISISNQNDLATLTYLVQTSCVYTWTWGWGGLFP